MSRSDSKSSVSPYIPVACAALGFAPLMQSHLRGLWAEEYYQYFPFVIAAVAWFMWERWPRAEATGESKLRNALFWLLLISGLLLLAAATLIWSAWLGSFAFVLVMGAAALQIYSQHGRITNQFGIWCLLWLLVPIPLQFDTRFVQFLQRVSASLTSQVLDLLSIDHLMSGTVLELPTNKFGVEEACSGIISVMSVIAAGGIYVVYKNRTLLHSIAVMTMGIVWAVAMNIGRITLIAVAWDWFDFDLAHGWIHDVLGLVLFSLTFISLISTDSLLAFLSDPIGRTVAEQEAPQNTMVRSWNKLVTSFDPTKELAVAGVGRVSGKQRKKGSTRGAPQSSNSEETQTVASTASTSESKTKRKSRGISTSFAYAVSAICLILGGLQLFVLARGYRDPETPVQLAQSIDSSLLPDEVGEWKKVSFEPIERDASNEFGNYSKQFIYEHQDTKLQTSVSLDFPYRGGWHELSVCYRNFGWPLIERTVTEVPIKDSAEKWMVINADYEKPDGQHGYLAFSGTNGTGDLLEPPSTLVLWRPWFRLRRRLLHRISPRFFQFQAWTTQDEVVSQESKDDVMELFLELRPYVLRRLRAGGEALGARD